MEMDRMDMVAEEQVRKAGMVELLEEEAVTED